ncbi:MAG: DNA repair protein RecN, partial [Cytophagia bacterium]|nr:DNA repair protein RecN [Cytophagia bacterium]
GETGAGKSIMLGALGLLMGNRADTKVLWNAEEKCVTEAIFDIKGYKLKDVFKAEDLDYDNTTVIRREISPGGKSRAFINDTPVTLEVMKKISSLLLDVHSQHETLLLGQQSFQLALVDAFAENENLRNDYTLAWKTYLATKKEYETLKAEAETLKAESDYIRFQLDELVKADLHDLDQAKLESEAKIMEHAEEIKQRFRASLAILQDGEYASRNSISEVRSLIQQVNAYAEKYNTLFGRIDSLLIELDDIIDELEREESSIDFDAERAEFVKERISTLYRLLKKHRLNDVAALIALQEELQEKANITDNVDEALATRKKAYEQAEKELKALAKKLSDTRHKVFAALAKEITSPLKELGIATAVIEFESQPVEPNATGADKIDILFSANKGISPRPLAQVASGGEFARLMFCIKQVMAEKQAMPTLVLDEIDTGVSGEIALKLGDMMKKMAKKHQLITISHLPQIAAKGDSHFYVYKDNSSSKTISIIKELDEKERIEKIA